MHSEGRVKLMWISQLAEPDSRPIALEAGSNQMRMLATAKQG